MRLQMKTNGIGNTKRLSLIKTPTRVGDNRKIG